MSIDAIIAAIDESTRDRCDKILSSAGTDADAKDRAWRQRAASESQLILKKGREEAERLKRQAGAEGRLEARKLILGRKREWLQKTIDRTFSRLVESKSDLYRAAMERILAQQIDTSATSLIFADDTVMKSLAVSVAAKNKNLQSAPDKTGHLRGGFSLNKGPVGLKFSLDYLLGELVQRHQTEILNILFGDDHV